MFNLKTVFKRNDIFTILFLKLTQDCILLVFISLDFVLLVICKQYNCVCVCVCVCVCAQSCPTLCQHYGLEPIRPLCTCNFSGKNIGAGCHFLFQGIFPTQGLNLCLLHQQVDSLPLYHLGSPTTWLMWLYLKNRSALGRLFSMCKAESRLAHG